MIQVVLGIIERIERERWNEMGFISLCLLCNKILDCANAPEFLAAFGFNKGRDVKQIASTRLD